MALPFDTEMHGITMVAISKSTALWFPRNLRKTGAHDWLIESGIPLVLDFQIATMSMLWISRGNNHCQTLFHASSIGYFEFILYFGYRPP